MSPLKEVVNQVMRLALAGDRSELVVLRKQLEQAEIYFSDFSPWGGYVDFEVPGNLPRIPQQRVILHDIDIEIDGVDPGLAVVLYVIDGALRMLEFAPTTRTWPDEPTIVSIGYLEFVATGPSGYELVPTHKRDIEAVNRAFAA